MQTYTAEQFRASLPADHPAVPLTLIQIMMSLPFVSLNLPATHYFSLHLVLVSSHLKSQEIEE